MSLGNFFVGAIVGCFVLSIYTNLTNLDEDIMTHGYIIYITFLFFYVFIFFINGMVII